jgi:hypothetical protein
LRLLTLPSSPLVVSGAVLPALSLTMRKASKQSSTPRHDEYRAQGARGAWLGDLVLDQALE